MKKILVLILQLGYIVASDFSINDGPANFRQSPNSAASIFSSKLSRSKASVCGKRKYAGSFTTISSGSDSDIYSELSSQMSAKRIEKAQIISSGEISSGEISDINACLSIAIVRAASASPRLQSSSSKIESLPSTSKSPNSEDLELSIISLKATGVSVSERLLNSGLQKKFEIESKFYVCNFCSNKFRELSRLVKHLSKVKECKLIFEKCEMCKKLLKDGDKFYQHYHKCGTLSEVIEENGSLTDSLKDLEIDPSLLEQFRSLSTKAFIGTPMPSAAAAKEMEEEL